MKTLSYKSRIGLIIAISTALMLMALCVIPIPQDPAYHEFLDGRVWLGIPNFGNVASNLPFILVGVWGGKYLVYTLGWYVLAKLFEHFDGIVFNFTGGIISGHSLKHVTAAVGAGCIIGYMKSCSTEARRT